MANQNKKEERQAAKTTEVVSMKDEAGNKIRSAADREQPQPYRAKPLYSGQLYHTGDLGMEKVYRAEDVERERAEYEQEVKRIRRDLILYKSKAEGKEERKNSLRATKSDFSERMETARSIYEHEKMRAEAAGNKLQSVQYLLAKAEARVKELEAENEQLRERGQW